MFIMRLDGNEIVFDKGTTSTIFVKWFRRTYQGEKVKLTRLKGTTEQKYRYEGYFA